MDGSNDPSAGDDPSSGLSNLVLSSVYGPQFCVWKDDTVRNSHVRIRERVWQCPPPPLIAMGLLHLGILPKGRGARKTHLCIGTAWGNFSTSAHWLTRIEANGGAYLERG